MGMLWLQTPERMFKMAVNPDYDPTERFEMSELKLQGQLADLHEIVPTKFHNGFGGHTLWNNDLIGWTLEANERGKYKVLAPILYRDYKGWHDKNTIFLNPILFWTYSALLRGPSSVKGRSVSSCRSTLEEVWGVDAITPGAIAATATYARFALSADHQLQPTGASTHILYQDNFEYYLQYLIEGLLKKKSLVLAIFRTWNKEFYPHSIGTIEANDTEDGMDESMQEALADLDADDEVEESLGAVSNGNPNDGYNTDVLFNDHHDPRCEEENGPSLEHGQSSSSLSDIENPQNLGSHMPSSPPVQDNNSQMLSRNRKTYASVVTSASGSTFQRQSSMRTAKLNEKNQREDTHTEKRGKLNSSTSVQKKKKKKNTRL
ncbi:hypothetical protein K439DRAFT_1618307 [Ramaria rubella]|nr:hypothetical protein K439DRAFT_1618307 [Ramaria rubella]